MKFYNIHANDGEIRNVEHLTAEELGWIIDYCRYRLGIDTDCRLRMTSKCAAKNRNAHLAEVVSYT